MTPGAGSGLAILIPGLIFLYSVTRITMPSSPHSVDKPLYPCYHLPQSGKARATWL